MRLVYFIGLGVICACMIVLSIVSAPWVVRADRVHDELMIQRTIFMGQCVRNIRVEWDTCEKLFWNDEDTQRKYAEGVVDGKWPSLANVPMIIQQAPPAKDKSRKMAH